jgi:predicted esterase
MAAIALGLMSGCASMSPQQRVAVAQQLVSEAPSPWLGTVIQTDTLGLMTFGPDPDSVASRAAIDANPVLTIYIEGDGHAWVGGRYPSDDPTPTSPLALELALAQPDGVAVYLARPCQYLVAENGSACVDTIWTRDRFAPTMATMVAAMNQAVQILKARYGAKALVLVGYSGGARIALELAAKRTDVSKIITVAGNLDPQAWVAEFGLRPLTAGTDNAILMRQLQHTPQWHWVGGRDVVVPKHLTQRFVDGLAGGHATKLTVAPDNAHVCCWVEQWPQMWQQAMSQ